MCAAAGAAAAGAAGGVVGRCVVDAADGDLLYEVEGLLGEVLVGEIDLVEIVG